MQIPDVSAKTLNWTWTDLFVFFILKLSLRFFFKNNILFNLNFWFFVMRKTSNKINQGQKEY